MRRVLIAGVAGGAGRAVGIASTLVMVPVALDHLGAARFGLWMTLTSAMAMLAFADLGVSNGVLTEVASAVGKDDRQRAARVVRAGLFILVLAAAAVGVIGGLGIALIDVAAVLRVPLEDVGMATASLTILLILFVAGMPLALTQKVRLGLQEGGANAVWDTIGFLISLGGLLLAVSFGAGLPWLVAAFAAGPLIGACGNALAMIRRHPWLVRLQGPSHRGECMPLLRTGSLYLLLQLAVVVAFTSDNLIIARLHGQEAVAHYSVVSRIFALPQLGISLLLLPLWSAYGDALARADTEWVSRTLKRSLIWVGVAAMFASVCLGFGCEPLLRAWTGSHASIDMSLRWGLGIWVVLGSIGNAIAMLLNAAQVIRFQVITSLAMAGAALILKVVLGRQWGVSGVIWGLDLAYLAFLVVPWCIWLPGLLRARLGQPKRTTDG